MKNLHHVLYKRLTNKLISPINTYCQRFSGCGFNDHSNLVFKNLEVIQNTFWDLDILIESRGRRNVQTSLLE